MQRSDLALRLLSFAMAAALVVFVHGERRVSYTLSVPVETKLAHGMEAASPLPETLRVSLSGPWARLRSLDGPDLGPVIIDLSRTRAGTASWSVRPESLQVPPGVRVESLHPAQGTVDLQRDRP